MAKTIPAIYEKGVFKPVEKINLPEKQPVEAVVPDEMPALYIAALAEKGGSFDFLNNPDENIYTLNDGEPV